MTVGLLQATNFIELLDISQEAAAFMIGAGVVVLIAALAATTAPALVGLTILIVVSLAWASDTAWILSIVTISIVSSYVTVEPVLYGWAVVHLIALSSLLRGVGGARALHALSKGKKGPGSIKT